MPDRIARVWTGSEWEVITSNSPSPNAVAVYQSASPSGPVTGQVWINSNTNVVNVWSGSAWVGTSIDASSVATGTLPVARGGTGTTTSTGTGSVVLSNASTLSGLTTASALSVSNNFTVDTNTLHVDSVNNRVGIGTTSPSTPLHVSGSPGTLFRLDGGSGGTGTRDIVITEFDTASFGGMIRYDSAADLFSMGTLENGVFNNSINIQRASGRVTMPFQPMFAARGPESGYTLTNGADIPFNNAFKNIGGHFNTSNHRFTAPIAGRYLICVSLFTLTATGRVSIKVNGVAYNNLQSLVDNVWSQSAILDLSANDYVTVGDWQSISGGAFYMGHSHFYGILLS